MSSFITVNHQIATSHTYRCSPYSWEETNIYLTLSQCHKVQQNNKATLSQCRNKTTLSQCCDTFCAFDGSESWPQANKGLGLTHESTTGRKCCIHASCHFQSVTRRTFFLTSVGPVVSSFSASQPALPAPPSHLFPFSFSFPSFPSFPFFPSSHHKAWVTAKQVYGNKT